MKRDRSLELADESVAAQVKEPLKPEASAGRNVGSLALADGSVAARVEEPPAASAGRNAGSLALADESVEEPPAASAGRNAAPYCRTAPPLTKRSTLSPYLSTLDWLLASLLV